MGKIVERVYITIYSIIKYYVTIKSNRLNHYTLTKEGQKTQTMGKRKEKKW